MKEKRSFKKAYQAFLRFLIKIHIGIREKLLIIFGGVSVVPLILLTVIAWQQIGIIGQTLKSLAVEDSSQALRASAIENIERMTTDTAKEVADFLYERDDDIVFLSKRLSALTATSERESLFEDFSVYKTGKLVDQGEWILAADGKSWEPKDKQNYLPKPGEGQSSNPENNDLGGFHYRYPETFSYKDVPLYDEITYFDLSGTETAKFVNPQSTKVRYPLSAAKKNVFIKDNTYIHAEDLSIAAQSLGKGEIYVSDVIGAYVPTEYIGMYTEGNVSAALASRGQPFDLGGGTIEDRAAENAYAGEENPVGERFEGIVRWVTPVYDSLDARIGYVSFALNHDHIMEFVDHITPMNERYVELPSAFKGNYAFIWDYKCRNICHPRHHSIYGFDPDTGDPQIPWLESSVYNEWQESLSIGGGQKWYEYLESVNYAEFKDQKREKKPAPELTKLGLVGLDGRYLNNAPQCTGWMDLTEHGGSGSFYIKWSGLYKLTTAGAIPYYTGQYSPDHPDRFGSKRGFGIVTIGAGFDDFIAPATIMEIKLTDAANARMRENSIQLAIAASVITFIVIVITILYALSLTRNIKSLNSGILRFRRGERQFRFTAPVKDEFGMLADSFDDMADSIVSSVKNPFTITDMDRKIIYMNEEALKIYKKELSSLVGASYSDISIYPSGTKYCPIRSLEDGVEAEIYYSEKLNAFMRGVANYLFDKDGKKIGYTIMSLNVTAEVRERMQIEEQRMLLDQIFSASPDLIWYVDTRLSYVTVNPRFASITGAAPDSFIGKTAESVLPAEIAAILGGHDKKALEQSTPLYSEDKIIFADGHEESLDSVRTPIYDSGRNLVGMLGFARNVTARANIESVLRQTQQELRKAVETANSASEHKGEFLARMSHEIRTPMNAIIGLTNMLERRLDAVEGIPHEAHGYIDQIGTSSQHLLGLLNDILDITKIEAGKIELADEVMEIQSLADTVISIIRPRCSEKNISFNTHIDNISPSTFKGDSLRLRQVLINLLGNAVKFTPELGTIDFDITKVREEQGRVLLRFAVKDTGIGISQEALKNIYEPFEQGGKHVAKKYGGTGLGLTISKRIVELFGGNMQVESTLGKGSTFSFEIWLTPCDAEISEETDLSNLDGKFTGKRALLVDDVDINRMIVVAMLEELGMETDEAEDGEIAVTKFKDSPEGRYDIIFMDIQMPNMNGHDASMSIRSLDRADAKTVPIIALTANAFKEDIEKAARSGMNAHLAKPIENDKLMAVLAKYLKS